jgi:alpha-galactosidase
MYLSEPLNQAGLEVALMDVRQEALTESSAYAAFLNRRLNRHVLCTATTDLETALRGADFVVCAIEVKRYQYWTQDFHIPRRYGFRQPYGENGGPGGIFHALRNIKPMMEVARMMERVCPKALLLNFTNPEHKICQAITELTTVQAVGLCHGVFMGRDQISNILQIPLEHLETQACGINHFTLFQVIRDRRNGQDLYPLLRKTELEGEWMSHWGTIGLGRILFRRFGLWPSPAANHYGEYMRWADEFVPAEAQFFHDPANGDPWKSEKLPQFIYELSGKEFSQPWCSQPQSPVSLEDAKIQLSGELAVPLMEGVGCGVKQELDAINVPNRGSIPNLPAELVVEVPATADVGGLKSYQMAPLPEAPAALMRVQASIHKLIVEAFAKQSKEALLQAILLEPTVDSYSRAVAMMNEMLKTQADILPPLH